MTAEERNIRERIEKTHLIVPEQHASIYATQRADIRSLIGIIDGLRHEVMTLAPKEVA